MTLLYTHSAFLEHRTGSHPERPERLLAVTRQLERTGLVESCTRPDWDPISPGRLERVHKLTYAEMLQRYCAAGGGQIEEDTVCSNQSYDVARLAAGAACDAVARVLAGQDAQALCLVRPPGHHALIDAPMGFCLFNNIALAARTATREFDLNRVLIIDWDVHHGNGTQDQTWTDPQIGFFSAHRWPFYPGTGRADETGTGDALGTKLNLPVEFGTPRKQYLDRFRLSLESIAERIKPELVLISAGFDAHAEDPVGSLGLETEDFATLTDAVLDVADEFAGGRTVSVLEGGYNTGILAGCVETHLKQLLARRPPSAS